MSFCHVHIGDFEAFNESFSHHKSSLINHDICPADFQNIYSFKTSYIFDLSQFIICTAQVQFGKQTEKIINKSTFKDSSVPSI